MTPSRKLLFPAILIILLAAIVASTGCVDPTKYDPCNPQQPPCGVKTSLLLPTEVIDTHTNQFENDDGGWWQHGYMDSAGTIYQPTHGMVESYTRLGVNSISSKTVTFRYSLNSAGYYQIDEIISIETPCPTNPCCPPTPCTTACCNCPSTDCSISPTTCPSCYYTPQPTPTPCKTPVGYTTYNNGTKVPVWGE